MKVEKVEGAVMVDLVFYMPRPQAHHVNSDRSRPLKATSPTLHTGSPDLDKLVRSVLDGLTEICFGDDAVVGNLSCEKFYGAKPGVAIEVRKMDLCDLKTKLEPPSQAELPGLLGTSDSAEST